MPRAGGGRLSARADGLSGALFRGIFGGMDLAPAILAQRLLHGIARGSAPSEGEWPIRDHLLGTKVGVSVSEPNRFRFMTPTTSERGDVVSIIADGPIPWLRAVLDFYVRFCGFPASAIHPDWPLGIESSALRVLFVRPVTVYGSSAKRRYRFDIDPIIEFQSVPAGHFAIDHAFNWAIRNARHRIAPDFAAVLADLPAPNMAEEVARAERALREILDRG